MVEPECHLWGEDFQPADLAAIENIQLHRVNEPGKIGTIGKYKGVPLPYGSCRVCTPEYIPVFDRISWMADFIKINKRTFAKVGATEIIFWIYWHGVQGNMEFTPVELEKIAKLKIALCIDYIQKGSGKTR
ncbi:MAG: hypothetical protein MI892_10175 [Desulfobacterales bacterium]|nr:hypothetical protein [Desulfobacterales bacterium]